MNLTHKISSLGKRATSSQLSAIIIVMWRVESGEWRVESGEWRVESVRVKSGNKLFPSAFSVRVFLAMCDG